MFYELLNQAIKDTHDRVLDNSHGFITKGWKKMEDYLVEFQSIIKDVKLPDDCFDNYTTKEHGGVNISELTLVEEIFKGKNYEILLSASEPDVSGKNYQKSKKIQVSGFKLIKDGYNARDIDVFMAIAQKTNTQFRPNIQLGTFLRIQSEIIDLEKYPDRIKNIASIIIYIQNATMTCAHYIEEQQACINATAERYLKSAFKPNVQI